MAQTGYTPIITYNSSVSGHVPTTGGGAITTGELAVNITDGILFIGTGTNTYNTLAATKGTTSIQTLGTITTGTWNASVIPSAYGGTGVNNSTSTITIGGNVTMSGAYTFTGTLTANTAVTFPTSGTLVNSAVTTLSSLASVGTITSGTWNATAISPTYGGTGVNNGSNTLTLGGNLTTSGAFATTLTVTAATSVTLPVSGTLGYINIPQNSQSAAYTTVASDSGYTIFHPASDANARTFTIAANSSVPYALGTVIQFINMSASAVTIAINTDTLTWAGTGAAGSRTLAQYGVANAVKIGTTQWLITGTNLT
jgi:hypothetical protein